MKYNFIITTLLLALFTALSCFAGEAVVRVKCDKEGAMVFVDDQPKGECPRDIFLAPGTYTIMVKKELPDTSYYSFEKKLTIYGDTVERVIVKLTELRYPEEYYWQACKNKDEKSCRSYLYKYPQGQYAKQAKKILAGFPNAGKHYTDPTTGMEFVYVPGGCYQMGDTFGEGDSDEKPVHKACVNGFYMGQYEVTQGEYTKIMGSNPSKFKNGDNYPVEKVSWNDARDFIKKLNDRSGKKFRLPTEVEWEYAAREGGNKVRFGTGKDTIGPDEANFDARSKYKKAYSRTGQYREQTNPVGSFSPNNLGLYDMSGNVWEWCRDWYGEKYYGSSPKDNPTGPSKGSYRVIRGGSWLSIPENVRAANRIRVTSGDTYYYLGVRLVLSSGQ